MQSAEDLFSKLSMLVCMSMAFFFGCGAADRERARATTAPHPFYEVFVDAPLAVCEARDPKGLYRKARAHTIAGFTGIDAPYERPEAPDLIVRTDERSIEGCELELFDFVTTRLAAWSSGNPAATTKPATR